MNLNKKGSVFIYVLMLINIALIIWYVVFNNTYILNNNINVWKNSEEVFLELSNKWNINIESVRQYNSNWQWFSDVISCPQNITMSWSTSIQTWIPSTMQYDYWTVFCYFEYDGNSGRIFFDEESQDFTDIYYWSWMISIINEAIVEDIIVNNNTLVASWTTPNSSNEQPSKSLDWNYSNQYLSARVNGSNITYDLWADKKLSNIIIYKKTNSSTQYWDRGVVYLKDRWNNVLKTITLTWVRNKTVLNVDLGYTSLETADDIRYIQIKSTNWSVRMNVSEIEVFELNETWNERWISETTLWDSDDTIFYFDSVWISGVDNMDDNMNSDNYRATSTGSVLYPIALWYPWNYVDDDITPRLTIFSSVTPNNNEYYNIFWNNHITNKVINDNINNDDLPTQLVKIWDVEEWYLFFDIFSNIENTLDYDVKIIEFDRNAYIDKNTLFPKNVWETKNLINNYWYLQLNANELSLSRYKTGNEFKFNFKDNDYAIFVINNLDKSMAIRINWEEKPISWNINDIGKSIFINPIDDSKDTTIETVANHIIIGWEKNFIWENFTIIWAK